MSFSLNSRIVSLVAPGAGGQRREMDENPASTVRRKLVLAAGMAPLVSLAAPERHAGLKRWGKGEYRRFGFLIYEASLWAGDDPLQPPLALRLDYHRAISGQAIAEASVNEMRRLGVAEASLARWGSWMAGTFPDVRAGDYILGYFQPDGASFVFNGQPIGRHPEPEFARRFMGIWLDPRTSAPALRAALLKPGDG